MSGPAAMGWDDDELRTQLHENRLGEDRPRKGEWGLSAGGRQFWPEDPRIGDVDIGDIAHALAHQCRFGGHCRTTYTVAQHSVLVASICSPRNKLVGLLHDASEAYLQDLIRPLKLAIASAYKPLEELWAEVIGLEFGLGDRLANLPDEVKHADAMVLVAERRDLMPPQHWKVGESELPRIEPWSPERARLEFLNAFHAYEAGRP